MFPEYRARDISVLTFNVTWRCPVKCPYCYITTKVSLDDKTVLSKEDLIRECELGVHYGIKEYRFSGGEPTIIGDTLFEYADLVRDITGQKPTLLTSGIGINDKWLLKAKNRFSIIAISVENPLEPLQTVVDNKKMLRVIKEHACDEELPLKYGLTLIAARQFKNVERIFDMLYENVDGQFMPQLDYPCLKEFNKPTSNELHDIYLSTRSLFEKYSVIPYYFVYLIGSIVWLSEDVFRHVINLYADGQYQMHDSLLDRWQFEYKQQNYALKLQNTSTTCQKCSWMDSCKHHPEGRLQYDWCDLRRAIFEGIYDGLGVGIQKDFEKLAPS